MAWVTSAHTGCPSISRLRPRPQHGEPCARQTSCAWRSSCCVLGSTSQGRCVHGWCVLQRYKGGGAGQLCLPARACCSAPAGDPTWRPELWPPAPPLAPPTCAVAATASAAACWCCCRCAPQFRCRRVALPPTLAAAGGQGRGRLQDCRRGPGPHRRSPCHRQARHRPPPAGARPFWVCLSLPQPPSRRSASCARGERSGASRLKTLGFRCFPRFVWHLQLCG